MLLDVMIWGVLMQRMVDVATVWNTGWNLVI
jgi:hypothetical protein